MTASSPLNALIFKYLPLTEKIFLAALGIGWMLRYLSLDSNVLFISLVGLATVYFLNAYKPPEIGPEDSPVDFTALLALLILPKVMWISSSISLIGVLFHLLEFTGWRQMVLIGAGSLGTGIFLSLVFVATGSERGQE